MLGVQSLVRYLTAAGSAVSSAVAVASWFARSRAVAMASPATEVAGARELKQSDFSVYKSSEDKNGERVLIKAGLEDMLRDLTQNTCRAVILGETHWDRTAHVLEAALYERLSSRSAGGCTLSLEMFDCDTQMVLDEYIRGDISEDAMARACRAWPNYASDYRPMVEVAKTRGMPVIAANAPARYVSLVNQKGPGALEKLSGKARSLLPPLPLRPASQAYRAKFMSFMYGSSAPCGGDNSDSKAASAQAASPAAERMLSAQSLWDAAMAWRIAGALARGAGPAKTDNLGGEKNQSNAVYPTRVLHVCGRFHVQDGLGIPEHLDEYLREMHCESSRDMFKKPGSAFRAIGRTAVFVPAPMSARGFLERRGLERQRLEDSGSDDISGDVSGNDGESVSPERIPESNPLISKNDAAELTELLEGLPRAADWVVLTHTAEVE